MKNLVLTYIIKIGDNYKIGKTTNLNNRLYDFKTYYPNNAIEVVNIYIGDIEQMLAYILQEKRLKREWYDLDEQSLNELNKNLTIIK